MPPKGSTTRSAVHLTEERIAVMQLLASQCHLLNIEAQIPCLPFMFGARSEVLPALLAAAPEGGTVADRLVSELRQRVSEVRATQGCTRNPPCVKSFLHLVMRPLTELCPRADPAAFAELAAALGVPHGVRCFSPPPRAVYLLSPLREFRSSPPPCTAPSFSTPPGVARCFTSTPA